MIEILKQNVQLTSLAYSLDKRRPGRLDRVNEEPSDQWGSPQRTRTTAAGFLKYFKKMEETT